ncbi:MAG: SUF system Fe-S cluster assembly protein [Burkholderiales bacterium]
MGVMDWLYKDEDEKPPEPEGFPSPPMDSIEGKVVHALRQVFDPEIPVNIYDLGLIYSIDIDDDNTVAIQMTLTAPGCPVAQTFPGTVENAVKAVEGVNDAKVELVWEPPWSRDNMSEAAKLELGML